ncbi:hypothetical protein BC624_105172 [Flavobacterium granuli]|uniref:Cyclophilin-like domain-containing protein n=2 Tax=Flavobacterium granuli TaxID=280093 RepID=A0A1M5NZ17_9FLAO|nr:hypothetical protein BC624_105172 [Flavobacterium granuli]SHG94814.1 hypothetical protein SAMN05443373_105172 [Flavobacterium granuli]
MFSFATVFAFCNKNSETSNNSSIESNNTANNSKGENSNNTDNENMSNKIKIKIGSSTFNATLENNATATAFKAMLPMRITMNELNNNEKYFDFSSSLPTKVSNPGTIQTGDLMLYGSRTFVLFYKTFSTSYRYTKLGQIDDTTGLSAALGIGNVIVSFEL